MAEGGHVNINDGKSTDGKRENRLQFIVFFLKFPKIIISRL